jgi:serine/threonine-protein kinase RsbW
MTGASELRLNCPAQPRYVPSIRHALAAFLEALGFQRRELEDVITAAGEALANAVEHAYVDTTDDAICVLELLARLEYGGALCIDVTDHGSFILRDPLPGRGFGLRIIRAVAGHTSVETSGGTRVRMRFAGPGR